MEDTSKKFYSAAKLKIVAYAALLIIVAPLSPVWAARLINYYTQYDLATYRLAWFIFVIVAYIPIALIIIFSGSKLGISIRFFPAKIRFASKQEFLETAKYSLLLLIVSAIFSALPVLIPLRHTDSEDTGLLLLLLYSSQGGITALFLVCVLIPIFEEFIVRGVALSQLLTVYKTKSAIIICAVMWMLAHPGNWILIFLTGILYSYVTVRLHSFLPAILGHAIINSMTAWMLINGF